MAMNYTAPLADMRFLLEEVAGLAAITELPGCEEATPDVVDAVLEEAGKFAAGVLAPLNAVGDRESCRLENGKVITPAGWSEAYKQFAEGGWVGLGLSPDFGGQGLPKCVATPVWRCGSRRIPPSPCCRNSTPANPRPSSSPPATS
jgi:acyl-CoA dehydrogenase